MMRDIALHVGVLALLAALGLVLPAYHHGNLARILVRTGDLDGATAAIERVEAIAKPVLDAGGEDAARLRKALDEMSARRSIQRARDEQEGAGEDAERFVEDELRDS